MSSFVAKTSLADVSESWLHSIDTTIQTRAGRVHPDLRASLFADLDTLRGMEYRIKRRMNACAFLFCLPPELLREVLFIVAATWAPSYPHKLCRVPAMRSSSAPSLGWISLGQVCHALRRALLDDHALWAGIVCVFPLAYDEILHRVGDIPVALTLTEPRCSHTQAQAEFIISHVARARTIVIYDYEEYNPTHADKWPFDPAAHSGKLLPFLEELTLFFGSTSKRGELVTADLFSFPPILTPRLRVLRLREFYVPFDPSTLTELHLQRTSEHSLPSPNQFLDMLRSCVMLRSLTLKRWIPPSLTPASEPTISMPLTILSLLDVFEHCITLCTHLSIPRACECTFDIVGFPVEAATSGIYFDGFKRYFQSSDTLPISGMMIEQERDNYLTMEFYVRIPGAPLGYSSVFERGFQRRLAVHFHSNHVIRHFISAAAHVIDALNLDRIEYFALGQERFVDDNDWSDIFSQLRHVHTLYIMDTARPLLIPLFQPSILPSLHFLWISSLRIGHVNGTPTPAEEWGDLTRAELIQMMLDRRGAGAGLKRLRINALYADKAEAMKTVLPRLRAIVPLVECGLDGLVPGNEGVTGLFATAVGSFIIIAFSNLQLSSSNEGAAMRLLVISQQLNQITQLLSSPGIAPSQPLYITSPEAFVVSNSATQVNILWTTSFFLSWFCALLATLVQQWTRTYLADAQR
ncbi:hypothetical protein K488DRAFT_87940 [Vararia minispora EC-137]|uniref:Uncharacterized protein n=1 Tax=Vararia minispora EC-137 TaxID=1314806 RepID=A0ACB8QF12_9AGAM|nr:hypothetical protein K488DRAFT_87940 [Vararia minispora EC-137]